MMSRKHTAYTEAVYKEQDDGTCNWLGRVYLYAGKGGPVETQDGIAPSRAEALIRVKAWAENILDEKYRARPEREIFEITSADVTEVNVEELGLD